MKVNQLLHFDLLLYLPHVPMMKRFFRKIQFVCLQNLEESSSNIAVSLNAIVVNRYEVVR